MMFAKSSFASAVMLALAASVIAAPQLSVPAQLQLVDTAVDRYKILAKDEDFNTTFPMANRKTFPALVGTNLAISVAELKPCAMASLHIHPHSAEIFTVISGRVLTETIPEAGVLDTTDSNNNPKPRVIRTDLRGNQTTVFPQGSFHAQVNPDCEPALAVAAFASDDPGAALVVSQELGLSDEAVVNSFGGVITVEDVRRFREAVPQGAIFDLKECRKKCGL